MDDISAFVASAVFVDSKGFVSRERVLAAVLLRRRERAGAVSERVDGLSKEETSDEAVVVGFPYDDAVVVVSEEEVRGVCCLLLFVVVLFRSSEDFVETVEASFDEFVPSKADLVLGEASEWAVVWWLVVVVAVCDDMCGEVNIDGEASEAVGVVLDGMVSSESGMALQASAECEVKVRVSSSFHNTAPDRPAINWNE